MFEMISAIKNHETRRDFMVSAGTLFVGLLGGCEKKSGHGAAPILERGLPRVFAANYPLAYFIQRIAGHEVEVLYQVPKGTDPAFWQPTDEQVLELQSASLLVMNGAGYSKWVENITLPESRMVDTSLAYAGRFIVTKNSVTHSHGKQGEHSHDGICFTTWLDFQQAILQADAVAEALKNLKTGGSALEQFAQNFDSLKKDLLSLDTRMTAVGAKLAGQPLIASHPVYHYWARRYHLSLESVLWEPEEVPDEKQMDDLKALLARHPAKWMIWEGEPGNESVEKLKTLGISSVVFDPCGNTPDKGDFLSVMISNLENLERAAGG